MRAGTAAAAPRFLQFARFCAVGAIGFAVDAGVLLIVLRVLGADPIWGRLVSFSVAVLTTFEFNRRWAFRSGGRPYLPALASYLGVQGLGFACNFGLYTLLYWALPPGYDASLSALFCLAAASAVALAVNYAGASLVVFRSRASGREGVGDPPGR